MTWMEPGCLFVVGPTSVGKSTLAVDVAECIGAEIVNADAFQIYRGLEILTAQSARELRQRVPHHLLGTIGLDEPMSAVRFAELAEKAIADIYARGKRAIVVSGSGLYVKALSHGFDETAPPDAKLREELSALTVDELVARLQNIDSQRAARTDSKNRRRVERAIEIATTREDGVVAAAVSGGRGHQARRTRDVLPPRTTAATTGLFLLRERDDLYERINERVLAMFSDGVENEIAALKNAGSTSVQALGLREIQQLLAGEVSRDECIARIQQKTRRYAKRQLTWFRHQTNFPQLNLTNLSHQEAVSAIVREFAQR